jgi:hypothetical protein
MCKEIPVNKGVDPKRIIRKNIVAEEEERHKGSLTQKTVLTWMMQLSLEMQVQNCAKFGF